MYIYFVCSTFYRWSFCWAWVKGGCFFNSIWPSELMTFPNSIHFLSSGSDLDIKMKFEFNVDNSNLTKQRADLCIILFTFKVLIGWFGWKFLRFIWSENPLDCTSVSLSEKFIVLHTKKFGCHINSMTSH